MNTNNVLEYLRIVYQLEKSLYQQIDLRRKLFSEINEYDKYEKDLLSAVNTNANFNPTGVINETIFLYEDIEKKASYKRITSPKKKDRLSFNVDGGVIGGFAALGGISAVILTAVHCGLNHVELHEIFQGKFWSSLFISIGLGLLDGLLIFLFFLFIYLTIKGIKTSSSNRKIKKQNDVINENNKKIIEYNNENFKNRTTYINNLRKEYSYLKNTSIKNTYNTLNEIYSSNVIYPKYQHNFVAIASMYEYFESGRCSTLGEAYNKFEEELRLNIIISKLDIIIKKLDEIKQNQYMIYDAITTSNKTNKQILAEIKTIRNQNENILENARIQTYNSKIIADNTKYIEENTNFLKWYSFLKE